MSRNARVTLTHDDLFVLDCALINYRKSIAANTALTGHTYAVQEKLRRHAVGNVIAGAQDYQKMHEAFADDSEDCKICGADKDRDKLCQACGGLGDEKCSDMTVIGLG